ncbi:hypothetical protein ABZT42_55950, partial [Streptomyces mirabilis]
NARCNAGVRAVHRSHSSRALKGRDSWLDHVEEFRPLFTEQERAVDEEDWEQADACYTQIRTALTMTFPDGRPVAEFMLHIHDDGTTGWRWHDEPFDAVNQ